MKKRSLFSHIPDLPTIIERLNAVVEGPITPASSRLLGFVSLLSEELKHKDYDGTHSDTRSAGESLSDVRSDGGYFESESYRSSDSESDQSGYEDFESDDDYDSEFYDSNDSERKAWAGDTEALVPLTKGDSDFVLDTLSGDIFTSIGRGFRDSLTRNLTIPEIDSRLRQISSTARRYTV